MRIAVWHNLPSGGAKRALFYHVRRLVERGHAGEVWRPPTADRSFLPLDGRNSALVERDPAATAAAIGSLLAEPKRAAPLGRLESELERVARA